MGVGMVGVEKAASGFQHRRAGSGQVHFFHRAIEKRYLCGFDPELASSLYLRMRSARIFQFDPGVIVDCAGSSAPKKEQEICPHAKPYRAAKSVLTHWQFPDNGRDIRRASVFSIPVSQ